MFSIIGFRGGVVIKAIRKYSRLYPLVCLLSFMNCYFIDVECIKSRYKQSMIPWCFNVEKQLGSIFFTALSRGLFTQFYELFSCRMNQIKVQTFNVAMMLKCLYWYYNSRLYHLPNSFSFHLLLYPINGAFLSICFRPLMKIFLRML